MSHFENTIRRYIDSFNETDAKKRKALIAALYADGAGYVDPQVALKGVDEIDGFIGAVQKHRQFHRL